MGILKGKIVGSQPDPVRSQSYSIPLSLMQQYEMNVDNIAFLMSIFRHIKFSSASKFGALFNKTVISHLKVVMHMYAICGFQVIAILCNNQCESMCGGLAEVGATTNIVGESMFLRSDNTTTP